MTPVFVEWVDMVGGERSIIDGPFVFVQFTYDAIRIQREGESDDDVVIGYMEDGLWHRVDDESGNYSDVVITAE